MFLKKKKVRALYTYYIASQLGQKAKSPPCAFFNSQSKPLR